MMPRSSREASPTNMTWSAIHARKLQWIRLWSFSNDSMAMQTEVHERGALALDVHAPLDTFVAIAGRASGGINHLLHRLQS